MPSSSIERFIAAVSSEAVLIWKVMRDTPPSASLASKHLGRDRRRVADQECALRARHGVELRARRRRPAAFAADLRRQMRPARKEGVLRLRVGLADEAHRVNADLELLGQCPARWPALAVEIDERAEALETAADDRDHQRKAERAGAGEGLRRAARRPSQSGRRG